MNQLLSSQNLDSAYYLKAKNHFKIKAVDIVDLMHYSPCMEYLTGVFHEQLYLLLHSSCYVYGLYLFHLHFTFFFKFLSILDSKMRAPLFFHTCIQHQLFSSPHVSLMYLIVCVLSCINIFYLALNLHNFIFVQ